VILRIIVSCLAAAAGLSLAVLIMPAHLAASDAGMAAAKRLG
jgi:hypothetical protein